MNDTQETQIHTRAVLVWLQIGTWAARKYDKAATAKILRDYSASNDAAPAPATIRRSAARCRSPNRCVSANAPASSNGHRR